MASSYDPYVIQLAELFAENPTWVKAMQPVSEGAASNVYFSHLPGSVWHLVKEGDVVDLRHGPGENPDFVFRFTPASIEALSATDGGADDVAVQLFSLILDDDPARRIGFRIAAPFTTLIRHGHLQLVIKSGPKTLAFGASHHIFTPWHLRSFVGRIRSTTPEPWEV